MTQYKPEYFVTDYLGSVRAVVNADGEVMGRNDYYPFGARVYDVELGRWLTPDPMAYKCMSVNPYVFCENNPIKFIDPDGQMVSTHTDKHGNVVAVYDDDDLGVYMHDLERDDARHKVEENYSEEDTSAGGEYMGESLHNLSFADQRLYNERGEVRPKADLKIDFGSTELTSQVEDIMNADPSVFEYASKARSGGTWNIKRHVGNGSLLFGKYASPRDAGNFFGRYCRRNAWESGADP